MTEPQFSETTVEEAPAATPSRRGRPRSQETIARDEAVLAALREGGTKTREQLAGELGVESSLVYLALWRLNRAGRVEKIVDGETGRPTQRARHLAFALRSRGRGVRRFKFIETGR